MSANKLTVTRRGNDVHITLPNGVEFLFHKADPWTAGSENIAHKAMLCLFDRIAALEAEKAERDAQEPVAWVLFDANLECMKPLYAHPLAMREPTEDECSRIYAIADRNPITRGPEIGEMPVRAGRAMWQAVREVMTK